MTGNDSAHRVLTSMGSIARRRHRRIVAAIVILLLATGSALNSIVGPTSKAFGERTITPLQRTEFADESR
jgi:hypothetical protein